MRRTFQELIRGYADAAGIGCSMKDGECQADLDAAGLVVHAGLLEESGTLILQAGVGLLPHGEEAAFCLHLLGMNNLFSGTRGMTLGVDREQELVTLQAIRDMSGLTAESFSALAGTFIDVAADCLVDLSSWSASASAAGAAPGAGDIPPLPHTGMIRV